MENPLVSIIVITYNSSKYVLETLESAYNQTYQNIELIVSDDCSTDNTVDICKEWINNNKIRFTRTELITVEKNTGIAVNCNRGIRNAKGKWLKPIAGDDILLKQAIEILIDNIKKNDHQSFIFGKIVKINEKSEILPQQPSFKGNKVVTFRDEFQSNKIYAPSIFFTREIYDKVNGFDETLKIEDIDFYLKILNKEYSIYYIDEVIAYYRVHLSNISRNETLMLEEHVKILTKYKDKKYYKRDYNKFAINVILLKINQNKFNLIFDAFKILSKNNVFVFLIFINIFFWYRISKCITKIIIK